MSSTNTTKEASIAGPTKLHYRAAQLMVEKSLNDGGFVSAGSILREAGYSEAIVKNPHKVLKSKGFRQALDEILPMRDLVKVAHELLSATKLEHLEFMLEQDDAEIFNILKSAGYTLLTVKKTSKVKHAYFLVPDHNIRLRMIDKILRVLGEYRC